MAGGTLMSGWRGRLYKEWTIQTQINVGSGLPETPIDSSVAGVGILGVCSAECYGCAAVCCAAGTVFEPGGLCCTAAGQWGNARRDAITGRASSV